MGHTASTESVIVLGAHSRPHSIDEREDPRCDLEQWTTRQGERLQARLFEIPSRDPDREPHLPLAWRCSAHPRLRDLQEEEYISNLSDIIKRDFFPQLYSLDQRRDIIRGLESQDEHVVQQSMLRMRELCTPTGFLPRSTRKRESKTIMPLDRSN